MSIPADDPLLYPPKELPACAVRAIDFSSWAFPAVAATLSICGGIAALERADNYAASLGIAAGVLSALGVVFTNWASRIRDSRLRVAHALGQHGFSMAADALTRGPGTF
jgi:hypothetical protein